MEGQRRPYIAREHEDAEKLFLSSHVLSWGHLWMQCVHPGRVLPGPSLLTGMLSYKLAGATVVAQLTELMNSIARASARIAHGSRYWFIRGLGGF